MPILHLTLYRKWFDLIATGFKVVEYRQDTPRWRKRLFNENGTPKQFDEIHFRNGYGHHRPLVVTEFLFAIGKGANYCRCANGEELEGLIIQINIGRIIRFENYRISNDVKKMEKSIYMPWRCGGCGVLVSLQESLCPACTAQLCGGGLSWTDELCKKVEVS